MLTPEKVAVVIPCFNEAEEIAALVREVQQIIPQVFVINDASTDATVAEAERAGADVFSNDRRMGKGACILRGLKIALARGYDWALLMDGDGQHSPADIATFLNVEGGYPLVIGNRMGNSDRMPWMRRTVNRWMSRRISGLAGVPLPDTQCGFRLVNLPLWNQLRFETRQFEIESEMVLAYITAGCKIKFVPIQTIYRSERSKIRPVGDTIRWLKWYFRARRRLASEGICLTALPGKKLQSVR